jgi:hypothetical protein
MAIVDINNLPTSAEDVEVEDYDSYVDASEFPPPLPDGTYTFKPLEVQFDLVEAQNGTPGKLTAIFKHEAFDDHGTSLGKLSFDRVSDKVFLRSDVKVSMMADQLRAWGDNQRYGSKQEKALAIKSHVDAGDVFKAVTKREVFCGHKDTPHDIGKDSKKGWTLKGGKIPAGETEMTCPVCQKAARVNSKVDRRIPR